MTINYAYVAYFNMDVSHCLCQWNIWIYIRNMTQFTASETEAVKSITDVNTVRKRLKGTLDDHLKDFNGLRRFGLGGVQLVTTSFLRCTHLFTVLRLTTLLVAKFKANPELSHLTARENVWDPLDHKRTGLLLIRCAWSWQRYNTVNAALQNDFSVLSQLSLTNFEEGAALHRSYRQRPLCPASLW